MNTGEALVSKCLFDATPPPHTEDERDDIVEELFNAPAEKMIPFSLIEASFGKPFHVNSEGRIISGEVPEAFLPDQCLGTLARNAVSSFSVLCANGAVDYLAENRKNKVILYEGAILFLIYTDLED